MCLEVDCRRNLQKIDMLVALGADIASQLDFSTKSQFFIMAKLVYSANVSNLFFVCAIVQKG